MRSGNQTLDNIEDKQITFAITTLTKNGVRGNIRNSSSVENYYLLSYSSKARNQTGASEKSHLSF